APAPTPPPASQCNTGGLQCCDSTQQARFSTDHANNVPIVGPILALLGIAVSPINAIVGVTCNPINVLGIGSGGACTAQPVCCQNNNFSGLIAIGCTPVTLGL
ncbi:hydrophobin, partial [Panaeolus papilionaceus]